MFRTISWSLALGEQSSQSPNKIYVRLASIKHPPIFRNPKTMAAIWSPFLNFADRRVCKKPLVSGMIEKTFRENRTQRSSVAVSLPFLNNAEHRCYRHVSHHFTMYNSICDQIRTSVSVENPKIDTKTKITTQTATLLNFE